MLATLAPPTRQTSLESWRDFHHDICWLVKFATRFVWPQHIINEIPACFGQGMLKIELIKKWASYQDAGGTRDMPSNIFSSTELVLVDGELKEMDREPGQNNIGMITWRCTLCPPEYPEGRDIVLLANDVTFKAGSFGVDEDVLFKKASEYARERGLPRIHIACNSGARVGLAEELKPFFKVKWTNDDPSKGFDYLYLEENDMKNLPDDAVDVHVQRVNGKKHYVIDAIIGEGLKSVQGGIGVENLRGSGLIAGETSKAYNEVFTLSYVTGRSVGIGAYLNRLGQRVIQMVNGPMILTGLGFELFLLSFEFCGAP